MSNNNFTVKAIETKYINSINNAREVEKKLPEDEFMYFDNGDGSLQIVDSVVDTFAFFGMDAPCAQLMAKLYTIKYKDNADNGIVNAISFYLNLFKDGVLTDEELAFLNDNYKESILALLEMRDWGLLKHSTWVFPRIFRSLLPKLVSMPDGSKLYTNCPDWGFVYKEFPNCIPTGNYGADSDDEKAVRALTLIILDALGIKSDLKCSDTETMLAEMETPSSVKVDLAVICEDRIDTVSSESDEILYNNLSDNGKMLILSDISKIGSMEVDAIKFRERIIKDHSLAAVIQLPVEFSEDSGDNTYFMVVIDKSRSDKHNSVLMVDATISNVYIPNNAFISMKQVVKVIDAAKNASEDDRSSEYIYVPYNDVDAEILLPKFYLTSKPKNGMPLSDILQVYDGEPIEGNPQYIDVKDFKDQIGVDITGLKNINEALARKNRSSEAYSKIARLITKPCILLCADGYHVYVGVLTNIPSEGYAVNRNITCLLPKTEEEGSLDLSSTVLFEYTVESQIKALTAGNVHRKLTDRLLSKVLVPNSDKYSRLNHLVEKKSQDFNKLLEQSKEQYEQYQKSVHLKKHALSQSISAFSAMFNSLNNCRLEHDGHLSDDDKLSIVSDKTVRDAFEFLKNKISLIEDSVAHIADTEYDFGKPEWIDPFAFIESYIAKNYRGWLNFKPVTSWAPDSNISKETILDPTTGEVIVKAGDPLTTISMPKAALSKILDNIISNAMSHAFTDSSRDDYRIKFSWFEKGSSEILRIENNGTPLKPDVDESSIMDYGYSTSLNKDGHSGIGCAEINSIMRKFGGEAKVSGNPKSEYTVYYELTFVSNIVTSF